MSIEVHDIVKLKITGAKQKYRVLGPTDTITDDCYQAYILDYNPICYEETLNAADEIGLSNIDWSLSNSQGDKVADDHTSRIYVKRINFYPDKESIIIDLVDFAEENWSLFIQRCKDRGMTESEIENAIETLKAKLFS